MITEELPRFQFYRGKGLLEFEQEAITNELNSLRYLPVETYGKTDSERQKAIHDLILNATDWVETELGFSVSKSAPLLSKIHFLLPREFEMFKKKYGNDSTNTFAFHLPLTNEIGVKEETDPKLAFYRLNHEIIHCLGRKSIKAERQPGQLNFKIVSDSGITGYANNSNDVFGGINEIITESANIESLDYYRRKPEGKDYLTGSLIGCHTDLIFFDMLLEKASKKLGKDPATIRHSLYRGYFKGQTSVLKVFNEVFGPDALKFIILLDSSTDHTALQSLAFQFGIDYDSFENFGNKVNHYLSGEEVEILDGIKIQCPDQGI